MRPPARCSISLSLNLLISQMGTHLPSRDVVEINRVVCETIYLMAVSSQQMLANITITMTSGNIH